MLSATLYELWLVAREMSAKVGGGPGYNGRSGPPEAPPAGISSRIPERGKLFSEIQDVLARKGVRVLTRENSAAVAELEEAISDAGSLSRKINAWESRWPLNSYERLRYRA